MSGEKFDAVAGSDCIVGTPVELDAAGDVASAASHDNMVGLLSGEGIGGQEVERGTDVRVWKNATPRMILLTFDAEFETTNGRQLFRAGEKVYAPIEGGKIGKIQVAEV